MDPEGIHNIFNTVKLYRFNVFEVRSHQAWEEGQGAAGELHSAELITLRQISGEGHICINVLPGVDRVVSLAQAMHRVLMRKGKNIHQYFPHFPSVQSCTSKNHLTYHNVVALLHDRDVECGDDTPLDVQDVDRLIWLWVEAYSDDRLPCDFQRVPEYKRHTRQ